MDNSIINAIGGISGSNMKTRAEVESVINRVVGEYSPEKNAVEAIKNTVEDNGPSIEASISEQDIQRVSDIHNEITTKTAERSVDKNVEVDTGIDLDM